MKPKEIILKSTNKIWRKWSIAFKIMPLIILVALLKFLSHKFGFEIMELNALFTSLVAGTIFLTLNKISMMNDFIIESDKEGVQANYIIKLKKEQNSIRKMILRIDTIRDTEFIGSAYVIVEAMGFLTGLGLIIIKIEPFYASLFITLLVTFLISYMFLLIKDLDNPFDYTINGERGTEISLKPIHDLAAEINAFKLK